MNSIVGIEITHCPRSPNVNIDQTAKRYNRSFSISPAWKLYRCPNDLLLIDSFFGGVVVPPENPDACTTLPLHFEETSLLKSAHAFSFALSIYWYAMIVGRRARYGDGTGDGGSWLSYLERIGAHHPEYRRVFANPTLQQSDQQEPHSARQKPSAIQVR
jgi:hypothetical protein